MNMVIGRLTNFVIDATRRTIYAADDRGLIYRIAADLSTVARSAGTSHGVAIHGITHDDHNVYTRDVAGNVVQWDKDGLYPVHFVLSQHCTEHKGDTAVPSPSNAIVCVGEHLLVCNAYGTVSVFDRRSMVFLRELDVSEDAFPEKICDVGDALLVSDVNGRLYRGRLADGRFERTAEVVGGVIHSIVPDPHFNRVWCTSDITGGVFFVDPQGHLLGEQRITNDDVEEIAIDNRGEYAYVGCFDHYVHVIQNGASPREVSCIGPFKFQINHLALLNDRQLVVLLESGELYLVETVAGRVLAQIGGTNAIWNFALEGATMQCATEHGNVERFGIASRGTALTFVRKAALPSLQAGRIRQLRRYGEGLVCGTSDGSLLALDTGGRVLWRTRTDGIVRDLNIDEATDEIVACTEVGEVLLLNARNGAVIRSYKNRKPVWCVTFDDDGHVVFGERSLTPATGAREHSHLCFLDRGSFNERRRLVRDGNHKRIRRLADHRLLVTGNGTIGVQVVDTQSLEVVREYSDWIINTPENAVIHAGRVYTVTYGYQLITYDEDSAKAIDVQHVTEGYPAALEVYVNDDGIAFLLLSGRNFLTAFLLGDDAPEMVCTRYLYDVGVAPVIAAGMAIALSNPAEVARRPPTRVLERTLSERSEREYA